MSYTVTIGTNDEPILSDFKLGYKTDVDSLYEK
jgi:hypothetical protein